MASFGRRQTLTKAVNLIKTLTSSSSSSSQAAFAPSSFRCLTGAVSKEVVTSHTAKWMQDTSKKSPMELINEVPPIKVDGRIVACEGDNDPSLGHPIEFICLDKDEPAICKYCGLRYYQDHGHHH